MMEVVYSSNTSEQSKKEKGIKTQNMTIISSTSKLNSMCIQYITCILQIMNHIFSYYSFHRNRTPESPVTKPTTYKEVNMEL
jgi:hypothetical protein